MQMPKTQVEIKLKLARARKKKNMATLGKFLKLISKVILTWFMKSTNTNQNNSAVLAPDKVQGYDLVSGQ